LTGADPDLAATGSGPNRLGATHDTNTAPIAEGGTALLAAAKAPACLGVALQRKRRHHILTGNHHQ